MKVQAELLVKDIKAKTSNSGNLYYQVTFVEIVETGNPENPKIERDWKDLYLNIGKPIENHTQLIGRRVLADLNFFTAERQHNGNTYTDIKVNIIEINTI